MSDGAGTGHAKAHVRQNTTAVSYDTGVALRAGRRERQVSRGEVAPLPPAPLGPVGYAGETGAVEPGQRACFVAQQARLGHKFSNRLGHNSPVALRSPRIAARFAPPPHNHDRRSRARRLTSCRARARWLTVAFEDLLALLAGEDRAAATRQAQVLGRGRRLETAPLGDLPERQPVTARELPHDRLAGPVRRPLPDQ